MVGVALFPLVLLPTGATGCTCSSWCFWVLLGALEYRWPARPEWVHAALQGALVGVFILTYLFGLFFADPASTCRELCLSELGENLRLDIWPTHWPLIAQAVLALFYSEFIWCWLPRRATPPSGYGAFMPLAPTTRSRIPARLTRAPTILEINPGAQALAQFIELLFGAVQPWAAPTCCS